MIQKLQDTTNAFSSAALTEPIVLCAADDRYVRPLAVTLHSAAQKLGANCQLKVIVLDGGISAENWVGLKETLAELPIRIFTIRPGLEAVRDLGISHHITHTAYLRLLAGRVLPESIDRVIYLDSDLLICDDLSQLWQLPLDGKFALAVPDIACPFVDTRHADCNLRRSGAYLSSLSPIRNWQKLGLDASAFYFNSGVMVLNINRMRKEKIEEKLLSCLRENSKHVWCWDQYALNVVFAGQWNPLPLRWNQGTHFYDFPDETHSPLNAHEFLEARDHPAIIHFTTEWKPWDYGNQHPLRERFFQQLDQTAWSGWRPEKPAFNVKRVWQDFATGVVTHCVTGFRRIAVGLTPGLSHRPAADLVSVMDRTARTRLFANQPGKRQLEACRDASKAQLTLFTIPKPFVGQANIFQRNALASWKQLEPFVEIVLIGDEPGTAEVAEEFAVQHLSNVRKNELDTPLVSSAFTLVQEYSKAPFLAWCNADVILFEDFVRAIERLIDCSETVKTIQKSLTTMGTGSRDFLAIGQRTEVRLNQLVDFDSPDAVENLKRESRSSGRLGPIVCKEFFVFPKGLYSQIPDFAVGRGNWDNWIVHQAKEMGVPVVSVSECVLALHPRHDYSHLVGGRLNCYVNGVEARQNQKLAHGRHLISGSTCDFRLNANSIRPSRMRSVHGEFWSDFPTFTRLLLNFVGMR